MKRLNKKTLFIAILSTFLLTGCATRSSVKKAQDRADEAFLSATQAVAAANEARRIAAGADERSRATQEMLDRSFKKSMRK